MFAVNESGQQKLSNTEIRQYNTLQSVTDKKLRFKDAIILIPPVGCKDVCTKCETKKQNLQFFHKAFAIFGCTKNFVFRTLAR